MSWDEDELILYADNDEPLYRQKDAFLANVHRKMKRGVYDPVQGRKLWTYYVDRAAQKYAKEYGGVWNKLFPKSAREAAAKVFEERERRNIQSGEYAKYPPVGGSSRDPRTPKRRFAKPSRAKQKAVSEKIRTLRHEGYPPKQAAAIAYRMTGVPERGARRVQKRRATRRTTKR